MTCFNQSLKPSFSKKETFCFVLQSEMYLKQEFFHIVLHAPVLEKFGFDYGTVFSFVSAANHFPIE